LARTPTALSGFSARTVETALVEDVEVAPLLVEAVTVRRQHLREAGGVRARRGGVRGGQGGDRGRGGQRGGESDGNAVLGHGASLRLARPALVARPDDGVCVSDSAPARVRIGPIFN
jgi:hypothetical protein